jgi:CBS domain-containing protein
VRQREFTLMLCWLNQGVLSPYQEPKPDSRLGVYGLSTDSQPSPVLKAREIMQRSVVTVEQNETAVAALELMRERSIHHLPVVDGGRLVGLISDRDLLKHRRQIDLPVQYIMTRRLLTARANSSLWAVAQIMIRKRINCVLIIDADQALVGILTSLDLLGCMTYQAPMEVWA